MCLACDRQFARIGGDELDAIGSPVGLPTVADNLPGFEASAFFGLGAPKSTPAEIVRCLNEEVNMALSQAEIMALSQAKIVSRFSGLGATVLQAHCG